MLISMEFFHFTNRNKYKKMQRFWYSEIIADDEINPCEHKR